MLFTYQEGRSAAQGEVTHPPQPPGTRGHNSPWECSSPNQPVQVKHITCRVKILDCKNSQDIFEKCVVINQNKEKLRLCHLNSLVEVYVTNIQQPEREKSILTTSRSSSVAFILLLSATRHRKLSDYSSPSVQLLLSSFYICSSHSSYHAGSSFWFIPPTDRQLLHSPSPASQNPSSLQLIWFPPVPLHTSLQELGIIQAQNHYYFLSNCYFTTFTLSSFFQIFIWQMLSTNRFKALYDYLAQGFSSSGSSSTRGPQSLGSGMIKSC